MMAGIDLILSTICNATFCDVMYDNTLTDSLSRKQIQWNHTVNYINGKHLKIATYNSYPLSWTELDEDGKLIGKGVSFVLIDILQEKFNFTYEVIVPKKNYEMGGRKPEDSLVGLISTGQIDMVAAFLPKMTMLHEMVSFSIALDEGMWVMMLKRPKVSAAGSGVRAPFNNLVWYLILASVLSFGPCITFLTRLRSRLIRDQEKPLPLSPSSWFVYSAFVKQGTSLSPKANATRILFATWWLFVILLSAFYTANLTAFLTLSKFTLDIEVPADLYKNNYKWVAFEGDAVQYSVTTPYEEHYYLNKMVGNGGEFRHLTSLSDYLPVVKNGIVLVKEVTGIEYVFYYEYMKKVKAGVEEANRCTYVVAPNTFMKRHRAFAYPIGSPLKILFDSILSHVVKSGIINSLKYRNLPSAKICPLDLQSKERQLTNNDLILTYAIMITGLSVAVTVFIGELLLERYIRVKTEKTEMTTESKKRFHNKNIYADNYDGTLPPPYESVFAKLNRSLDKKDELRRKIINGREYHVYEDGQGGIRLVPIGTPSALLYRQTTEYN